MHGWRVDDVLSLTESYYVSVLKLARRAAREAEELARKYQH